MTLNMSSPIPLHVQLKEKLMNGIGKGEYTERIPSERELMETFAVSRTTVREAVSALVRDGFLQKIHGKGTFVTKQTVHEWLGTIKSFTETIESMGMRPGIRLLWHGVRSEPQIAAILGVEEYYVIERLRFADDEPIAVERTHYAVEIGLKLAEHDLNRVTIYKVLEANGVILNRAEQKITAGIPSPEDAKSLKIPRRMGILAAERVTFDPENRVVEYYSSVFRADKYAFCVMMSRNTGQNSQPE